MWIWKNQHHFLIMKIWDALNVNVNRTKTLSINVEKMFESRISVTAIGNHQSERNLTQKLSRGPTTRKDMRTSAWRGIANWQTKRQSNCTQFQRLARMITTSRRRSWKQSENCPMYVLKSSQNACTWLELVDLTFYGP